MWDNGAKDQDERFDKENKKLTYSFLILDVKKLLWKTRLKSLILLKKKYLMLL
jgi:hypothetical protein